MTVRLTVIMVESAPPTATGNQLAEKIVGNLIGRPGIDLTLIRSLSNSDESSTDRLMIDGIACDVAVLDWQSPDLIVKSLNQVGFFGRRAAHPFDSEIAAASEHERRIYAFDLNQFFDPAALIDALDSLKSDRQMRTFSIGPTAGPVVGKAATNEPDSTLSEGAMSATKRRSDLDPPTVEQFGADIDLDDLIDQLDQSDT